MTTYEQTMNLELDEDGSLKANFNEETRQWEYQPPLEIPPTPEGVNDEAWQVLHRGFHTRWATIQLHLKAWFDENPMKLKTVFQMTEDERLQWCAETAAEWEAEREEENRKTERDIAWERDYYAGGNGAGLDPFAYDSQGNDTGLRMSDFI